MKGVRNLRPSIRFIHRRVVSCAFPSPGQYPMRGGGQYSVRANIQSDQERQARDKARIALEGAPEATRKLYNAVRRGDLKAVRALLLRGADASSLTPEGEPLVSFALRQNRHEIVAILQGSGKNEVAP